ncbi:MAG TPA: beta-propeller fold lactonase family protein [Polyangiaceae bacterium]|jgi:DNA-binding beta-propeller fold protein YncE|nr:beta-propeller fold lactonase family protein [Polyangiaceae bacterium]
MDPRRPLLPLLVLVSWGGLVLACSSSNDTRPTPAPFDASMDAFSELDAPQDDAPSTPADTGVGEDAPAEAAAIADAGGDAGTGTTTVTDAGDAAAPGDAGDAAAPTDAADASAPTGGPFVYFADNGGGRLFAFTLSLATGALASIDTDPNTVGLQASIATEFRAMGVAAIPNGKYVYTAELNGNVGQYAIDPATGVPSLVNRAVSDAGLRDFNVSGASFESIGIDAKGRELYVPDANNATLYALPLDPTTGEVGTGHTIAVQSTPRGVGVDPAGHFLFLAGNAAPVVSRVPLDGTGFPIGADAGGGPLSVSFNASGNCLQSELSPSGNSYTVCSQDQRIYGVGYDAGAAAISTLGFAHAGGSPLAVTVHPNGHFAYAASFSESSIYTFSLDASGAPAAVGSPLTINYQCRTLKFDPTGTHMIAGCDGRMVWLDVDGTTGALTAKGNIAGVFDSTYSMAIVTPPLH